MLLELWLVGSVDVELQTLRAAHSQGVGILPLTPGYSRPSCICFTVIDLVGFRVCVLSSPLGTVVQGQFCFKTCSELSVPDLGAALVT